jgi:hypothetical protein
VKDSGCGCGGHEEATSMESSEAPVEESAAPAAPEEAKPEAEAKAEQK